MWSTEYYRRPNGRQPLAKFCDRQPKDVQADIEARMRHLAERGLELLKTPMLVRIVGDDKDLYELRGVGLKWRVAVYFDRPLNKFVLLNGWRKKRGKQVDEIERAHDLLHEYL